MKELPTLADLVYRHALKIGDANLAHVISSVPKFVLDANASRIVQDLSRPASWLTGGVPEWHKRMSFYEEMRALARTPFDLCWIELDLRARVQRGIELGTINPLNVRETTPRMGWLLRSLEPGTCEMIMYQGGLLANGQQLLYAPSLRFVWNTTDESFLPIMKYHTSEEHLRWSAKAIGDAQYLNDHVMVFFDPTKLTEDQSDAVLEETRGELRFVWALLANMNVMPCATVRQRPAGSQFVKGKARPYLEHSTIQLRLQPHQTINTVANSMEEARKRKRHQVRGHWRTHGRFEGKAKWVESYERGDASLGWVLHDYEVRP